jgi:hypothetical protein
MVAAWIADTASDDIVETRSNVTLSSCQATRAWVTDILNVTE